MTALLRLSAGLIGWAIAFCAIYALHGIGCAAGWDTRRWAAIDLHRAVLLLAWCAALLATLATARRLSRHRATTLDRTAAATAWTGFAATIITFAPLVAVPTCL